jgi:hypothetical protein
MKQTSVDKIDTTTGSTAGGCQYLAVKMVANTEAVST